MPAEAQRLFDIWEHQKANLAAEWDQDENDTANHFGSLTLDSPRRWVLWKGEHVMGITEKEFQLLETLVKRSDCIFSRSQLLDLLWAEDDVFDRAVDTMIKKIRTKFRFVDASFDQIGTRYNAGYFWKSEPATRFAKVA